MKQETEKKKDKVKPIHRVSLTKIGHVRDELARLYRSARRGELAANEAGKLTYILVSLARIIEGGELEKRVDQLEQGKHYGVLKVSGTLTPAEWDRQNR
jgi:hypothetical protein